MTQKFKIRFNKSRGNVGRGSVDHVWRVFEESGREYLCKHIQLNVPSNSEIDSSGVDWNFVCYGVLKIDRETSTIKII